MAVTVAGRLVPGDAAVSIELDDTLLHKSGPQHSAANPDHPLYQTVRARSPEPPG
jgi:hypothetical protein